MRWMDLEPGDVMMSSAVAYLTLEAKANDLPDGQVEMLIRVLDLDSGRVEQLYTEFGRAAILTWHVISHAGSRRAK